MRWRSHFIRNLRGLEQFEAFLVAAVATILGYRLFLELTGYPQVGTSTIHIAHAELGGLLMASSIVIRMIFLSKRTETLASIVGGAGFGLFIDEVGKFITEDNNYFFQPAVSLIYVTIIAFYLGVRYVFNSARISQMEYMVNAIREMRDIPGGRLQQNEQQEILYYLGRCEQSDPLVQELEKLVGAIYAAPSESPGLYARWKRRLYRWYRHVAHSRWFAPVIMAFFILQFIGAVSVMLTLMFDPSEIIAQLQGFTIADWAILASNVVSAVFIALGVFRLRGDHLGAFLMFERSVLVSIFVGQLFLFYKNEFGALSGLVFDLLLYMGLHFIIERERDEVFERQLTEMAPAAAAVPAAAAQA